MSSLATAARIVLLSAVVLAATALAQRRTFRVMEYNVENLFDTIASHRTQDADFTPDGAYRWTSARYWAKLSRLSRVVAAVGEDAAPALVALVEVENDSVVTHLTRRTKLWQLGYEYLITHSPDVRGINVALLYQPALFRPVGKDTLRVAPTSEKLHPTRDMLHVAGLLPTGDTLDVVVCHWPSKRGGTAAETYRNHVARSLRTFADSLMNARSKPQLLITGDFNAYYPEPCLMEHLGLRLPETRIEPRALYLLSSRLKARHGITGTYKYAGEWNQLDNFIVSGTLLSSPTPSAFHTRTDFCRIADFDFLLTGFDTEAGPRPFRSFLGTYYQRGFSDHLPLVLDFVW